MRRSRQRAFRPGLTAVLAAAFVLGLPSVPAAHEIPADVTVQAFVKPGDGTLRVLLRVPLGAMRDVDWPLVGPGYLDLAGARPLLADQARLWIADYVAFREDGRDLGPGRIAAARVSLPNDRSFEGWDAALEHVRSPPLPDDTELAPGQALLDVLLEYPLPTAGGRVAVDPRWAHLGIRTQTVLRYVLPSGGERAFRYEGDPGLVRLDPRWYHAAWTFTRMGFWHILGGIDHLLFVLCLVIPLRSLPELLPVVTAFTVAHSITLLASALGLAPDALWFPPLVETLIALSIVWMAFENIVGARLERRWLIAFGFGLVHGFGFSFALRRSLQFAGGHLLTSLLAFNVGVELGQVLVLVLLIPVLDWLFRRVVAERMGVILLSALVAHTAWHWMLDRGSALLAYRITAPALDQALLAAVLRWLMLALVAVGAAWLLSGVFARLARSGGEAPAAEGPWGTQDLPELIEGQEAAP